MIFLHPEYFWGGLGLLAWAIGGRGSLGLAARRRDVWSSRPGLGVGATAAFWLGSALLILVALARPVWDPQPVPAVTAGQNTVFVVDVSRSMLSQDLTPNRLAVAKSALLRLSPSLGGDAVGLVAFAGSPLVLSPLTRDRAYFEDAVRSLAPELVPRGGSRLGDALTQVLKTFGSTGKSLTLWVLTDGGDQASQPLVAAQSLADKGVRLNIWGLGTDIAVPVPDRPAVSALDRDLLKSLTDKTPGGRYLEGTADDFLTLYREVRVVSGEDSQTILIYQEGAPWLLGLLALAWVWYLGLAPRLARRSR